MVELVTGSIFGEILVVGQLQGHCGAKIGRFFTQEAGVRFNRHIAHLGFWGLGSESVLNDKLAQSKLPKTREALAQKVAEMVRRIDTSDIAGDRKIVLGSDQRLRVIDKIREAPERVLYQHRIERLEAGIRMVDEDVTKKELTVTEGIQAIHCLLTGNVPEYSPDELIAASLEELLGRDGARSALGLVNFFRPAS